MASWMAEQARPGGEVVGLDLNGRFFHLLDGTGVRLQVADVRSVELAPASFDFIHARLLLMHVPNVPDVLRRFLGWLKPGGWLVVGDFDFSFRIRTVGVGALYQRLLDEMSASIASRGGDATIGSRHPTLLLDAGFEDVDAGGSFPLIVPGDRHAEHLSLNVNIARPVLSLPDVSDEDYDELLTAFRSGEPVLTGEVLVTAWGRRPLT